MVNLISFGLANLLLVYADKIPRGGKRNTYYGAFVTSKKDITPRGVC